MNKYLVEQTTHSPKVVLDLEEGVMLIEGESRPEDVEAFYSPIAKWFEDWGNNIYYRATEFKSKENHTVRLFFDYFNSSSAKKIMDLLIQLKAINDLHENIRVIIEWAYLQEDEDIEESGRELEELAGVTLTFTPLTDE